MSPVTLSKYFSKDRSAEDDQNTALATMGSSGDSAYSTADSNPKEAWQRNSDLAERRRIQNRIAQRHYRKKLGKRLEDLERRATSSSEADERVHIHQGQELLEPSNIDYGCDFGQDNNWDGHVELDFELPAVNSFYLEEQTKASPGFVPTNAVSDSVSTQEENRSLAASVPIAPVGTPDTDNITQSSPDRESLENHIVHFLASDDDLRQLCHLMSEIGKVEFARNFRRFLENYARNLKDAAVNRGQNQVAALISRRSEQITQRLIEVLLPSFTQYLLTTIPEDVMLDLSVLSDGEASDEEIKDVHEYHFDSILAFLRDEEFTTFRKEVRRFVLGNISHNLDEVERSSGMMEPSLDYTPEEEGAALESPESNHGSTRTLTYEVDMNVFKASFWRAQIDALSKWLRPQLKPGYRRIEWRCACGETLWADFRSEPEEPLDILEAALHKQSVPDPQVSNSSSQHVNKAKKKYAPNWTTPSKSSGSSQSILLTPSGKTIAAIPQQQKSAGSRFFAICISVGGIYKKLKEIDLSDKITDMKAIDAIKNAYEEVRGGGKWRQLLFRPVRVEFVLFELWETSRSYVDIYERPECVPPKDSYEYEFNPRPVQPIPPLKSNIFIHYLRHNQDVADDGRHVWVPRFPKRIDERLADQERGTFGWGISIVEGWTWWLYWLVVMLLVTFSSVVVVIWSVRKDDVQGGTGIGSYIITVMGVIMAAIMFHVGSMRSES